MFSDRDSKNSAKHYFCGIWPGTGHAIDSKSMARRNAPYGRFYSFAEQNYKNMIVPLFLEQLLVMLVGLADTLVVSFVSEAAVSGVSLVNSFNTIFVYLFTALASGGAVVISQYIGRQDQKAAGGSASQLLMISTLFSLAVSAVVLLLNERLMALMFGRVEAEVKAG